MYMALASFSPQMAEEDILQYCKILLASIENDHALVEQSFLSMLPEDEDLKHYTPV